MHQIMAGINISDNIQHQIDEIEALSAIYGDEWCTVDEANRCYCIRVDERHLGEDQELARWTVKLQFLLPDDYPSHGPPLYQINASWLRGNERDDMCRNLEKIYRENHGECIIYLWVESIRDSLQNKLTKVLLAAEDEETLPQTKETEEVECNGFDFEDEFLYEEWDYQPVKNEKITDKSVDGRTFCPEIHHGATFTDRRSTFQAHLARVRDRQHVQMVLDKLYENKKIANATHNIYAYRIKPGDGAHVGGCDDDGETHAGSRMLHLLKITDVVNVMVVVSRWYGGILLGPDRFKHINNCTRNILVQHDFITVKESPTKSYAKKIKTKS